MRCENYLCIYELNGECGIDDISLDVLGQCNSCIYPNIDKKLLEKLKNETLANMME